MTVVVLGWDGLDYDRAQAFGLADRFGSQRVRLNTFDNPSMEKPHTYEVWPSIITGVMPYEHGIHAEDYTEGGSWESPLLNVATVVSKYVVPERIRWAVGRKIRERGAAFAFESLDYYRERGTWTVFDGREAFPLGIPNARSRYDDELGIVTDRGAALGEFLDIETGEDGETVHRPSVSARALATRLEAELGEKMGAVRQAVRWDFDLVFVWLGYLDTMGHVAPAMAAPDSWMQAGYETAAEWTDFIRRVGGDVVCVSDHGLTDGSHSEAAFFGWWRDVPAEMPASVLDVAETIDGIAPRSERRHEPHSASERKADFDGVNERLRDLGYLE